MKRLISLLIPLCVAFAMITAVSFANTDDPEQVPGSDPAIGQQLDDETVDLEGDSAKGATQENKDQDLTAQEEPPTDGWFEDAIGWRFFQNGVALTGKKQVPASTGPYYFFESTGGYMQTGWVTLPNGHKNYYDPTPGVVGESKYGTMKTGWLTYNNSKYYLNPGSGNMHVGFLTLNNNRYFFDDSGKMHTGWKTMDDGSKYYFNPSSGKMHKGWLTLDGSKYYFNKSGKMHTGWLKLTGDKYYFGSNGKMYTGKHSIGEGSSKATYYFNTSNGKMKTNYWYSDGGSKYYFGSNGKMLKSSWLTYKGNRYYFGSNGKMLKGRHKVGSSYYYFNTSSGRMAKATAIKISGKLHYFFSSGKEVTGTGWFKGSDKKSRYATGGGTIATGKKTIGGNLYEFSSKTGICIANYGDTYDQKIRNYSSGTGKLVYVIKSKYQVRVYSGSKGRWNRIYTFTCALGDASHPTASGTFTVGSKTPHHNYTSNQQKVHWNNGLNISGTSTKPGAGFNGYVWSGTYPDGDIVDSRLGGKFTGGRIRVSESNSVWMYNNIGVGTKVVIQ